MVAATVLGVPTGAMVADSVGWPVSFTGLALLGLIAVWFPGLEAAKQPPILTEVSLLWRPGFLIHLDLIPYLN